MFHPTSRTRNDTDKTNFRGSHEEAVRPGVARPLAAVHREAACLAASRHDEGPVKKRFALCGRRDRRRARPRQGARREHTGSIRPL